MHWYGGSIAEAVTLSKQKNAIFVVFVEGENELSSEMNQVLDDAAVLKRLADSSNFLAIRLKSGSTDYTHFAQIYQFVPVPSLFFIGRNGTPLEVVCAGVEPGNLAARIDRIIEEHHKNKPAQSSSSADIKVQTVNLLTSEAAPGGSKTPSAPAKAANTFVEKESEPPGPAAKVAKLDDQSEVVCNDGVCVRRPRTDGSGPSSTPDITQAPETGKLEMKESTLSAEEKMERAKALIEAKRKEKEEKEKQLEKEKEKERRNLGQGVAELKRWQADQEMKQLQEERKREKLENDLARQRILDQIAQDRAERRARDVPPEPQPRAESAIPQPQTSGDASTHARIQFKLPDGTSHTAHFEADDTLATVQRHVAENLNLSASQFSLWSAFPRRELVEADATLRGLELAPSAALLILPRRAPVTVARPAVGVIVETDATLRGLELAPSAALLILPRRAPVTVARPAVGVIAFITQLLSSIILEPSHRLYAWLMSYVTGGARPPAPPAAPPRRASPGPVRRRGNVHRLHGETPDDDNNTWNGNSTQQM